MRRKAQLKQEQIEIMTAYVQTFSTDVGIRVLRDLEKSFDDSCFVKGDPYETAFKEGRRDVVLRIRAMMEIENMDVEVIKEEEEE